MPSTHQASFGTMGAIHASDSLKHERGMSRLEGGPGPWRDLWFLRPGHPRGWDGSGVQQFIPNLSKHSRSGSTGRGSLGLWDCGGLFCFLEDFFFFWL